MDSSIVYGMIGTAHFVGFVVLIATVKFGLKKKISDKILLGYVGLWLIGLFILPIAMGYGFSTSSFAATLGELFGLALVFLIGDFIILSIGRWFYRVKKK